MGQDNLVLGSLTERLAKLTCFDQAGDNAVVITGSGRSGTSWLANACNYRNDFRYIFEPLNQKKAQHQEFDLSWSLDRDSDCSLMDQVIMGRCSGQWINSRNRKLLARRRLLKFVRANLMLEWITKRYPLTKSVILIRNPISVAASRKKLAALQDGSNWVWEPTLEQLLSDSSLVARLTVSEQLILSEQIGKGIVRETIADWIINNIIATQRYDLSRVYKVFYESLVGAEETTVNSLFTFLDIPVQSGLSDALHRSSETARAPLGSQVPLSLEDRQAESVSSLSAEELDQAFDILGNFEFARLYGDDMNPVIQSQLCNNYA